MLYNAGFAAVSSVLVVNVILVLYVDIHEVRHGYNYYH